MLSFHAAVFIVRLLCGLYVNFSGKPEKVETVVVTDYYFYTYFYTYFILLIFILIFFSQGQLNRTLELELPTVNPPGPTEA